MSAFFASLFSILLLPFDWLANIGGGTNRSDDEGSQMPPSYTAADNTNGEITGDAGFSPYSYTIGTNTSVSVNQDTIEIFDPDGIDRIDIYYSPDRVVWGIQKVSDEQQIIQLGSLTDIARKPYVVDLVIVETGHTVQYDEIGMSHYYEGEWIFADVEVPAPSSSNPDVSPAPLPTDDYLMA